MRLIQLAAGLILMTPFNLAAQTAEPAVAGYTASQCPSCAEWNAPTPPVRIFGNVYYVGPRGLTALLLTSPEGHVLLDAGLPESGPRIAASIRALGFRVEDIKVIVNSHTHFDHAGGIAFLQRISGAAAVVRQPAASVVRAGRPGPDDPQYRSLLPYPSVSNVRTIDDGDTVRVGSIVLIAHATAGHTPGGTSWSWRSCAGESCLDFVYADSQTPISDDGFLFSRSTSYPAVLQDFEHGYATLERLACDVLITPHPGASRLWERLAARDSASAPLGDGEGCRRYAANARQQLARRLASESGR